MFEKERKRQGKTIGFVRKMARGNNAVRWESEVFPASICKLPRIQL